MHAYQEPVFIRQGGFDFGSVGLFVCLSVCLLATLLKKFLTDCNEILCKGLRGGKWNK